MLPRIPRFIPSGLTAMKVRSVRAMRGVVRFAVHCRCILAFDSLGVKLHVRSGHDATVGFLHGVDATGETNAIFSGVMSES